MLVIKLKAQEWEEISKTLNLQMFRLPQPVIVSWSMVLYFHNKKDMLCQATVIHNAIS